MIFSDGKASASASVSAAADNFLLSLLLKLRSIPMPLSSHLQYL
jgi:hypothetical protein